MVDRALAEQAAHGKPGMPRTNDDGGEAFDGSSARAEGQTLRVSTVTFVGFVTTS
jgi:hypothetical protein